MDDQELDSEAEDEGNAATVFGVAFDWGEEQSEESESADPDVLRFGTGGLAFATDAIYITEVESPPPVTAIPGLPPHVLGVAVRRRHVLSVVDLAIFFGLPAHETGAGRLLVFDVNGLEVGVIVSSVAGLEVWPEVDDAPDLDDLDEVVRRYVTAAHWAPGGRVLLLDMPELLREAAVR